MSKLPTRLSPTPSVLKRLFAHSGNRCSNPDCKIYLVDEDGVLLAKVAHICAAEPKGPRYDKSMSDEARRAYANLILLCGVCHDKVDAPVNAAKYPEALLLKWKAARDAIFQKAEHQLLADYADVTQASQPTYPINLRALGLAIEVEDIVEHPDDLTGLRAFIDRLKECPLEQRRFALKISERTLRRGIKDASVDEVMAAFNIGSSKLQTNMKILDEHGLGWIHERNDRDYVVRIAERDPSGNPFHEILQFCNATGHNPDELILDLNFAIYDAPSPA